MAIHLSAAEAQKRYSERCLVLGIPICVSDNRVDF